MPPFSHKQTQFILNANSKWNLAHGSVRSGKTVGTLFKFMCEVDTCPDSKINIVGHTSETVYQNVIALLFSDPVFSIFKPFCNYVDRKLKYKDKTIHIKGAKDAGAIGTFQGNTWSLGYCDEITLYPEAIIDMIDTRLSPVHAKCYAAMNPSYPSHKVKKWVDLADAGDPNYFSMHFTLDDNPYVADDYKMRIKNSLSGLFYKRNYLGLWCLSDGAIFDFFDRDIYVKKRAPAAADYYVASIDYGAVNPFCCLIIGVSTGIHTQTSPVMWVEDEYYYDPKVKERQQTNRQFAEDVVEFIYPYGVTKIYIDPSAASFKVELRQNETLSKMQCSVIDANNDVLDGLTKLTSEMKQGNIFILDKCKNLIREIEGYCWDTKAAERGEDKPIKSADHACVTGDTTIQTDLGLKKIKDVIPGDRVLSYKQKFIFSEVQCSRMTRRGSDIFKVTLENGKILRCTGDHKVMTHRGYIEVQNLLQDDEVLCYD